VNSEKRLLLAVLSLSLPVLLGAFSMDMLLPALPEMANALQLTPGKIQWTLNVFVLGFALCQLAVGLIATRLGIHVLFLSAVVLFTLGSVGIGMSSSYSLILLLRFVQALAACTTLVISMALITQTFRDSYVTQGHSILSGVTSLGPLLAPVAGAFIVNFGGSWRNIFFALALIGCVVLTLFIRRGSLFDWRNSGSAQRQSYALLARSPYFCVGGRFFIHR
jgi:MFS transporter, DHA1 family, multidrug resistance protein